MFFDVEKEKNICLWWSHFICSKKNGKLGNTKYVLHQNSNIKVKSQSRNCYFEELSTHLSRTNLLLMEGQQFL